MFGRDTFINAKKLRSFFNPLSITDIRSVRTIKVAVTLEQVSYSKYPGRLEKTAAAARDAATASAKEAAKKFESLPDEEKAKLKIEALKNKRQSEL